MSITDELRSGGTHLSASNRRAFGEEELVSIADRIEDAAHEEAKRIAKMAFDGGIEYERTCRQYNCDAKAYNWDGWLKTHAALFKPKPTVQSVLLEFLDALDIDRCADFDATIAEFAAKLRIAEEGDA